MCWPCVLQLKRDISYHIGHSNSININTVNVDPHYDSLQNGMVKPMQDAITAVLSMSEITNCERLIFSFERREKIQVLSSR